MSSPWDDAPFVEVPRVVVACPSCRAADYVVIRSMGDQGDGTRQRRCICRLCSSRFIVAEIPASEWQGEVDTHLS